MHKKTSDVIIGNWRAVALAAIATAALSPLSAAASDADPTAALTPELRHALRRDLKMAPGEIARYLEVENKAGERQDDARRALGAQFGGAWFEQDTAGEYRLVVGSTDHGADAKARRLGLEVRRVRHSLDKLDGAKSALDRRQSGRKADPAIHGWYVDLPSNTVVVETDPGAKAQQAAIDFIAASAADPSTVRMTTSKLRPQPTAYNMRGGDKYTINDQYACSIGFPAVNDRNIGGFLTAGHCGTVNQTVKGYNGASLGFFAGSTFPVKDYAWVAKSTTAWVEQPWVYNYNGGNIQMVGNREAPVGAAICRSGHRTGYRCGKVVAKNVTVNYGSSGTVYGLTQSTACTGQGDSGGSFITPGREAQGVTSGGALDPATGHNCGTTTVATYHQPLQPMLAAYRAAPQTIYTCGRLNARWQMSSGAGVESCDGRFVLYMRSDGLLILHHYGVGAIWTSRIYGTGNKAIMRIDGNLVVYNSANKAVWATSTYGRYGAALFVQNDGNVVVRDHLGRALWATYTGGR